MPKAKSRGVLSYSCIYVNSILWSVLVVLLCLSSSLHGVAADAGEYSNTVPCSLTLAPSSQAVFLAGNGTTLPASQHVSLDCLVLPGGCDGPTLEVIGSDPEVSLVLTLTAPLRAPLPPEAITFDPLHSGRVSRVEDPRPTGPRGTWTRWTVTVQSLSPSESITATLNTAVMSTFLGLGAGADSSRRRLSANQTSRKSRMLLQHPPPTPPALTLGLPAPVRYTWYAPPPAPSITSAQHTLAQSSPAVLVAVDFGRRIQAVNGLEALNVTGLARTQAIYDVQRGRVYLIGRVPDAKKPSSVRIWVAPGAVKDAVGQAFPAAENRLAYEPPIPAAQSAGTALEAALAGGTALLAVGSTVAGFVTPGAPPPQVAFALAGALARTQAMYLVGELSLPSLPPVYREASQKLRKVMLNEPIPLASSAARNATAQGLGSKRPAAPAAAKRAAVAAGGDPEDLEEDAEEESKLPMQTRAIVLGSMGSARMLSSRETLKMMSAGELELQRTDAPPANASAALFPTDALFNSSAPVGKPISERLAQSGALGAASGSDPGELPGVGLSPSDASLYVTAPDLAPDGVDREDVRGQQPGVSSSDLDPQYETNDASNPWAALQHDAPDLTSPSHGIAPQADGRSNTVPPHDGAESTRGQPPAQLDPVSSPSPAPVPSPVPQPAPKPSAPKQTSPPTQPSSQPPSSPEPSPKPPPKPKPSPQPPTSPKPSPQPPSSPKPSPKPPPKPKPSPQPPPKPQNSPQPPAKPKPSPQPPSKPQPKPQPKPRSPPTAAPKPIPAPIPAPPTRTAPPGMLELLDAMAPPLRLNDAGSYNPFYQPRQTDDRSWPDATQAVDPRSQHSNWDEQAGAPPGGGGDGQRGQRDAPTISPRAAPDVMPPEEAVRRPGVQPRLWSAPDPGSEGKPGETGHPGLPGEPGQPGKPGETREPGKPAGNSPATPDLPALPEASPDPPASPTVSVDQAPPPTPSPDVPANSLDIADASPTEIRSPDARPLPSPNCPGVDEAEPPPLPRMPASGFDYSPADAVKAPSDATPSNAPDNAYESSKDPELQPAPDPDLGDPVHIEAPGEGSVEESSAAPLAPEETATDGGDLARRRARRRLQQASFLAPLAEPHPTTPSPHPTTPSPHPTTPSPHPMTPSSHPTTPSPHPTTPSPHPMTPSSHPMTPSPHPTTPSPHPSTLPHSSTLPSSHPTSLSPPPASSPPHPTSLRSASPLPAAPPPSKDADGPSLAADGPLNIFVVTAAGLDVDSEAVHSALEGTALASQIESVIAGLNAAMSVDSPEDLQPLWNCLFWLGLGLGALVVVHGGLTMVWLWLSARPMPQLLAWPRLELSALLAALPLVAASAAQFLPSRALANILTGALFAVGIPLVCAAAAAWLVLARLQLPPTDERAAVYVLDADRAAAAQGQGPSAARRLGQTLSRRFRRADRGLGGQLGPRTPGKARPVGGGESGGREAGDAGRQSPKQSAKQSPRGIWEMSPGSDVASPSLRPETPSSPSSSLRSTSPRSSYPSAPWLARGEGASSTPRAATYAPPWWETWLAGPLLGYDGSRRGRWQAARKVERCSGFLASHGPLFEAMRGPPVVQKDGPRGPMEPLPRPSLRDRIATLGTAIDLLKRVLFVSLLATVASTKKPVQLFPICVMLGLSLLHVLYLRLLGPALALVDSLGEMLSALCDAGTFACGVVVARTPVEQRRKLTILGVCMLACQILGILCALVPRIVGLCIGFGCWCAKCFGGGAGEGRRRDASDSPARFWFGRRKKAKHPPIILDPQNIILGSTLSLEPSARFATPPPPVQPSQEAASKAARWASIGRAGKRPFAPLVEAGPEPGLEQEPELEQEPSSSQLTPEAKVPKDAAAKKREAMQRLRAALGGAPCEGPAEEQGEELIPCESARSESRDERHRDVRSGARSTPSTSVRRLFSSPLKQG